MRSGQFLPESNLNASSPRSEKGLTSLRCSTGSSHFTSRSRAWSSRSYSNKSGAGHKHSCEYIHGSNLCCSNCYCCCLPAHRQQRQRRRLQEVPHPDPRQPADGRRRHKRWCNSLLSLQSERRLRIEEGFCSCPLRRSAGAGYSIHSKKFSKSSHSLEDRVCRRPVRQAGFDEERKTSCEKSFFEHIARPSFAA